MRSENGQLLMIPQQALAQMQAQAHAQAQPQTAMAPRPAAPSSAPPVQISAVQVSAPRPVPAGVAGAVARPAPLGGASSESTCATPALAPALLSRDLAFLCLSFLLQSGDSARAPVPGSDEGRE